VDPDDVPLTLGTLARALLLAPDTFARAAAAADADPQRRWLLRRPRAVRRSFVDEVIDAGGTKRRQERWLLLQDEATRASFVADVIDQTSSP
jgi:hypothetical protein